MPGTKHVLNNNRVMNEYMNKRANIHPRSKSSKKSHCLEDKVHNEFDVKSFLESVPSLFLPTSHWFPLHHLRLLKFLSETLRQALLSGGNDFQKASNFTCVTGDTVEDFFTLALSPPRMKQRDREPHRPLPT